MSTEKKTFDTPREAIKHALRVQEVKPIDLCNAVGYNRGNFYTYLRGERPIPDEVQQKILTALNIKFVVE